MYQFEYTEVVDQGPAMARSHEREAILRTIGLMKKAEEEGVETRAAIDAVVAVQRLWGILIEDLARPENELPPKLRADLISIGLWILRQVDDIRAGSINSFRDVIEVSGAIADGLR